MAQEFDLKGLRKQRKAKKRKRFFKKFIAVMIIFSIAAVVYITKDNWLPFFDGIASRVIPTSQNTGQLADGLFPIKIAGNSNYQIGTLENYFSVVDDTNFYIYTSDGKMTVNKQHSLSKPILRTNSKKALIYDMGGTTFSLESKYKNAYTKTVDNNIILARLSSNDNVAVITKSDKFLCVMTIYNGSGDVIYTWKCAEGRIIDVNFTNLNDGVIVTTVDATKGQIVSKLHKFTFGKDKEIWASQEFDSMVIATDILQDGTIVAVGDTKCAYYTKEGILSGEYNYKTELVDYSFSDTNVSLLFRNEERRESNLVIINNINSDIKEIPLKNEPKKVFVEGTNTYLLNQSSIDEYSMNGTKISNVSISDEYYDFHKIGTHIYLLGHSDINRIEFSS